MAQLMPMRDLRPRLITAAILIPLVISGIFLLPPLAFHLFNGAIFGLAAWEWSRLSGINHSYYRSLYLGLIISLIGLAFYLPNKYLYSAAGIGWLLACIGLMRYQQHPRRFKAGFGLLTGVLILPACWQGLNSLCLTPPRPHYLLVLFVLIWSADSVAYFAGSRWGKHKLAPRISPGKSWEGVAAALCFTLLIAFGLARWIQQPSLPFMLCAVLTVIASIIGDLFESMLKRQQGLKDSGKCLPGHGGILDRIDSLTAAIPLFVVGLSMLS